MSSRRVVVTGIGAVTPLGLNIKDTWSQLIKGASGVQNISRFDASEMACRIAGEVSGFKAEDFMPARDVKKMDKFIHYGIAAATEAIEDARWLPNTIIDQERTGVMLGSGIGGIGTIEYGAVDYHKSEHKKISPFYIPSALVNLLSGHVSIKYGFTGPNSAIATACSTSAHAIGDASRMIKYGDADVMIAGGAESPLTHTSVAGFAAAKALTTKFNDAPTEASRPWDAMRSGFVMGEGAGVVVLEEYEHAKARNAKIYAEVAGYGLTGDAFHITAPSGRGARRAMENALKDAKILPEEVDYINAHGTSTLVGDGVELQAVQEIFCNNSNLKMSSTKSAIGHMLGAAGSVEAIFTMLSMQDNVVPPTLNLHNIIEEAKIDLVPLFSKEAKIRCALTNSFGFGGTNASLVLRAI